MEETNKQIQTKVWNNLFTRVFVVNALLYLAQQINHPLIAKYSDYLGASPPLIGVVISTFAITALIFKIVTGPVVDTFNRRRVLMVSMGILALSCFTFSISYTVSMLICASILQGVGQTFVVTCCLIFASETLPPQKLGAGIGVFSMAQAAGQAIGPVIGLTLEGMFGYNVTFAIGGCIMVIALIISSGIKVPFVKKNKFKLSLKRIIAKEALLSAAITLCMMLSFCLINSFLILYAESMNVQNIGLYFTVYSGTLLITRPLVGRLTDRFGTVKILIPAMLFFAGALFYISYCRTLPMFLLAAFISAFGYGASQPAMQTLAMKMVPNERRGASGSTNYIGMDIGYLIGPIVGGYLIEGAGYVIMWRIMVIPVIIGIAFAIIFRKKITNAEMEFSKAEASAKF